MKMKFKKLWLLLVFMMASCHLAVVNCQEEEQETTTEPYIESTTTEAPYIPPNLQTFDYRFVSYSGDFSIDVNVTEIEGNTEQTEMSILVTSTSGSAFAESVCNGTAVLIAVPGQSCPDGITPGTQINGDIIAHIDKASKFILNYTQTKLD